MLKIKTQQELTLKNTVAAIHLNRFEIEKKAQKALKAFKLGKTTQVTNFKKFFHNL